MVKCTLFISACILMCFTALIGQRFESLNDKYPIARANCIYQDDFGFIWFGTRDGLVKYDGYSITNYRKSLTDPHSLPGAEVLSIVQVSDSILFVGMGVHGLVKFNRNTGKSYPFPSQNSLINMNVYALLKDHRGNIWIASNRGLFRYEQGKLLPFKIALPGEEGVVSTQINNLYQDSHENIWIGTTEGIHLFSFETNKIENPYTNTTFPNKNILDINEDNQGNVWISVSNDEYSLYKFDSGRMEFSPAPRFKKGGEYKFVFDLVDNLWISSHEEGVIKSTGRQEILFSPENYKEHGLRALFTQSIVLDKYQNLWILGDAIYKISGNNKNFKWLETDEFQVTGLYADEDYIWYCGREPMRWSKKDGSVQSIFNTTVNNSSSSVTSSSSPIRMYHFEEMGDSLIFTSINDVYIWNKQNDVVSKFTSDLEGAFRDFIITPDQKLMIAANMDKVVSFDPKTSHFSALEALKELETACAVATSKDGTQWWGTHEHGLFMYNPYSDDVKHYIPDSSHTQQSLSSYNITDVMCHSDGTIWVGTKVGLDRIDPITKQINHYPFGSRINHIFVASIIEDDNGSIWIGTQNGLYFLDPKKDLLKHYTDSDGILNTIYTPRASYKDEEGQLYFGGMRGIDYFQPNEIGENDIPPDLYLKSLKVHGKNYSDFLAGESISEITLSHKDNYVEIELQGLHMTSSNGNLYSYKLEPQISDWVYMGKNRVITLGKLTAGEYKLQSKCANPDGIWSPPKHLLTIHVLPPFWLTSWFISMLILAFIGTVYWVYYQRIATMRKKELIKTEINKQIAEIEMKALRAQMNPHFLFNCLNSIKLLIVNNENEKARKYITKFSELIRQVLDNSRKKLVRLDEELKSINIYLQLEQMRFKNFTYSIEIEQDIPVDFIDIPPLLIQPFVENALWHGLMNKQTGDKNLKITISRDLESILIIIDDNGIGRKQAQLLKSGNMKKTTSLGTQLSQNRVKVYNDVYDKKIDISIIDLKNPIGTRVIITLPGNV